MDATNFQVGEKFPLPIKNQGEGGLFQVDGNGIMFILQLSHADIIAIEAFRTGKMELALYENSNILFLLYQIDGIFKAGWGDAPLALHLNSVNAQITAEKLTDKTIHMYLVDTTLQILLAQRTVPLNEQFFSTIRNYITKLQAKPSQASSFMERLQGVWNKFSSAQMREKAIATQEIPLSIPNKVLH